MTAADIVIEQLAADLAEAEENVARYRMLALAAIARVHELTVDNERKDRTIAAKREEIRTLVAAEGEMTAARQRRATIPKDGATVRRPADGKTQSTKSGRDRRAAQMNAARTRLGQAEDARC